MFSTYVLHGWTDDYGVADESVKIAQTRSKVKGCTARGVQVK